MSQLQTPTVIPRQTLIVQNDSIDLMDSGKFDHMQRVAKVIAASSLLPKHLQGTTPDQTFANCFRVLDQASRWGFNPFSVVDATYVVSGKLGFEGKLVAAVINARGGLHDGLLVNYNSETGPKKAAVIYGSAGPIPKEARPLLKRYLETSDGEAVNALINDYGVKAIRISVEQAGTSNQMWTKDPEQKLFYTGATKWARRFKPEMLLGVLTEDDLERLPQYGEQATPLPATGGSLADKIKSNGTHAKPETPAPEPPKQEPPPQAGEVPNEPTEAPAGDADEGTSLRVSTQQLASIEDELERTGVHGRTARGRFNPVLKTLDDATPTQAEELIEWLIQLPDKGSVRKAGA